MPVKELRLEFPQETALGPDNPQGSHPHPVEAGLCTESLVSALKVQKLQTEDGWALAPP